MIYVLKRLLAGFLILAAFMLVLVFPTVFGPFLAVIVLLAFAFVLGDMMISKDPKDDNHGV